MLLFFILLGGVKEKSPLNEFYWIEFDTDQISSSLPNPVRWTLYNYCGVSSSGKNIDCTKTSAAFPFKPQSAFHTTNGIPSDFIDNESTYFYLSKISYAFYLIAISFLFLSFLLSCAACFSRLGGALAGFLSFLALLFATAASAMLTANFVMGKNAFGDNNIHAKLGVKMFAFTWTVVALLLLSFILLCCVCVRGSNDRATSRLFARRSNRRNLDEHMVEGSASSARPLNPESSFERTYDSEKPPRSGRGFFHVSRKRNADEPILDTAAAPPAQPIVIAQQ